MKTAAIIAEYNPFHNGHAYLIQKVRELSGADYVIAVMSGDFVQRGEPAVLDKYDRTEMALSAGVNLVLELPCAAALGSSRDFAESAIAVLDGLHAADELWFGSESGRMQPFEQISGILADEPEAYRQRLRRELREGKSYPTAQSQALRQVLCRNGSVPENIPENVEEFLSGPNNILGIAYCTALKKCGSNIRPRTIRREGEGYHSAAIGKNAEGKRKPFCSAEAIRAAARRSSWNAVSAQMPERCFEIFYRAASKGRWAASDDLTEMMAYQLWKEDADSLGRYYDISAELANRILRYRAQYRDIPSFIQLLKTRNQTWFHIARVLMHILLGITEEDVITAKHPSFVRVLGFRDCGPLLEKIKHGSSIDLVTKASRLKQYPYRTDLFASSLYEMILSGKSGAEFVHEYSRKLLL